jgi:chromate transporter
VDEKPANRLLELARLFLKLGTISFGGPAAHIALMHHEVVERRRWLTDQEFLDLVGATNLIPGPNSTEMAIHVGLVRGGWPGLLIAGACFIAPAVLIVGALAALYVRYGALPQAQALFTVVKPVVIAIVAVALWRLGRTAIKVPWHAGLAVAAVVAAGLGMHELALLAACGLLGAAVSMGLRPMLKTARLLIFVPGSAAAGVSAVSAVSLSGLFVVFLKVGAVLFGSGYVLLAFLRADLVERLHWLTESQLLDAISIGQVTPGPVFTTATFIGYQLAGVSGAIVATVAIFLPAFAYVAASGPLVPKLRRSAIATGFLDGVNVASIALMAVVTWQLGRSALIDTTTVAIALASGVAIAARVNPTWLIGAAVVVGIVRSA